MAEDMKTQVTIALEDQFTAPLKELLEALKAMTENTVKLSEQVDKVSTAMDNFQAPLNEVKTDIQAALKPLETMAKDNKELKNTVQAASKQLEAGNSTLKHMANAMEGSCKSADHLEREMSELKSVNQAQAQQINTLQNRLSELAEAHRRAAEEAKKQKEAENTLEKKLASVKELAQGAGQALQGAGQVMQGMGAAMMAPAAAAGALGFGAVQESMSTDWAATRLGNTFTNEQAKDRDSNLKEAKELALKLAMQYPGSTEDVLATMASMAEMGVEFRDIINGGANSAVQFASMFNMGFEDAGRAMVQFGNNLGVNVGNKEQGEQIVDELQRLRAVTGADASSLQETFKYLGPSLATLGQQGVERSRETSTILAMLNKTSMGGSMAGTNYGELLSHTAALETTMGRRMFQKIYGETIARHGIDLQFFDESGKFRGQREMIKELGKLKVLSEKEQLNITKKLFGETGGRVAAILAKQGVEGFDKTRKYMDDQLDAQTSLGNIMDTYRTKFETLQASMASIKVIAGDQILEGLNLKKIITDITDRISEIGKWLQTKEGGAALQEILSPLKKIPEYIDLALSKLDAVGRWVKDNPQKFAQIGKILLAVSGIALPLGGMIIAIGTGLVAAGSILGGAVGLVTAISGAVSTISAAVGAIGGIPLLVGALAVVPALIIAATEAGTAFAVISKYIYNHWEDIKAFADGFMKGLASKFDGIKAAAERVKIAFEPVLDMILQAINWLLGTSSQESAQNSLANGYGMGSKLGEIIELILTAVEAAGRLAQAVLPVLGDIFIKIYRAGKAAIGWIVWIYDLMKKTVAAIKDIGFTIAEYLFKPLEGPIKRAKEFLGILRQIGLLRSNGDEQKGFMGPQVPSSLASAAVNKDTRFPGRQPDTEARQQGIQVPDLKSLLAKYIPKEETVLPSVQELRQKSLLPSSNTVNNSDYSKTSIVLNVTSALADPAQIAQIVEKKIKQLIHERDRTKFAAASPASAKA